jgi:hypothetical protein
VLDGAICGDPTALVGDGRAAVADALEDLDILRHIAGGYQALPCELAQEVAGRVSGDGLARAVETDDAALRAEDHDHCADRVKQRGDEVALDGQLCGHACFDLW